jgi:hypothetical protein
MPGTTPDDTPAQPTVGEPLPRAAEAYTAPDKWEQWILADRGHGWEWTRVFRVGPADLEQIWRAIAEAVLDASISSVRRADTGVSCAVDVVLEINARTAAVRTVWHYADAEAAPRLVTAFPAP